MQTIPPISPIARSNIKRLSLAYMKVRGIKASTLSRLVHSDPRFLEKFWSGEVSTSLRIYDRMVEWFLEQDWKGAKIPKIRQPFGEGKGNGARND